MKKVVVFFPDTVRMSEFILNHEVFGAEAYTKEQSLIAPLEEESVITALLDYGGHLNVEWPFKTVSLSNEHSATFLND